jgi:lipoprotein-releasing system permease protein
MNLPFRIAFRYFLSRKKRSFISVVAMIAMIGVGVGTMALIVVLSVFNGMEDLNRRLFKTFDPDIKISAEKGRRFAVNDGLLESVRKVEGVQLVTQVVEDNALASYNGQQIIVRLKGVDSTFELRRQLDTAMISGTVKLTSANGTAFALLSDGIRSTLLVSIHDQLTPLELWYPRNDRKTLNLTSPDAFNQVIARPGGTFFIESRYDDYVIVPLKTASDLFQYQGQCTSLEVQLTPGTSSDKVLSRLQKQLGNQYKVQDRDALNSDLLRAIRVEKLFVTVALSLIILVAAINIFFSLSMLAIEKKEDVKMLYSLGATSRLIKRIFLSVGVIVALSGASIGLIAGVAICWIQEKFGLVSMGMTTSLVEAYPVKLEGQDVAITAVILILITLTVSVIPAYRAAAINR